MTTNWLQAVLDATVTRTAVRAVVISCQGSCPRETGAAMLVWADRTEGTVGGGSLEHDVIAAARKMLEGSAAAWLRDVRDYHLGPDLNQCCGGAVRVLLERYGDGERAVLQRLTCDVSAVTRPVRSGVPLMTGDARGSMLRREKDGEWFDEMTDQNLVPLIIHGAGHVARALVRVLDGLPFSVTWIDVADDRFPSATPPGVRVVVSRDPAGLVASQPVDAFHLVMTHSHELDEAIVAAVMRRGSFGYLGMIGSETKAARFRQRLARAGFGPDMVARLVSPIGLTGLAGKEPAVIAVSVAADLMMRRSRLPNGG